MLDEAACAGGGNHHVESGVGEERRRRKNKVVRPFPPAGGPRAAGCDCTCVCMRVWDCVGGIISNQ